MTPSGGGREAQRGYHRKPGATRLWQVIPVTHLPLCVVPSGRGPGPVVVPRHPRGRDRGRRRQQGQGPFLVTAPGQHAARLAASHLDVDIEALSARLVRLPVARQDPGDLRRAARGRVLPPLGVRANPTHPRDTKAAARRQTVVDDRRSSPSRAPVSGGARGVAAAWGSSGAERITSARMWPRMQIPLPSPPPSHAAERRAAVVPNHDPRPTRGGPSLALIALLGGSS